MRTCKKNKQPMYYAMQTDNIPIYETDEDGNIIYTKIGGVSIPIEIGKEIGYTIPAELNGNIAMSGGEAEAKEFGLSINDYNAIIVCTKGEYPIKEGSLIWHENEVGYKDEEKTKVDPATADYIVIKAPKSINQVKYILKANVK